MSFDYVTTGFLRNSSSHSHYPIHYQDTCKSPRSVSHSFAEPLSKSPYSLPRPFPTPVTWPSIHNDNCLTPYWPLFKSPPPLRAPTIAFKGGGLSNPLSSPWAEVIFSQRPKYSHVLQSALGLSSCPTPSLEHFHESIPLTQITAISISLSISPILSRI